MTSTMICVLPNDASMSNRSRVSSSGSRGSTCAVPPAARIALATVWTIVSCLRISAPPFTELLVKKCNPESAFFPQIQ